MESKKLICLLFLVLIITGSFASAITGSIGNARMILKPEKNEIVERSILVKNVNNISVDINLTVEGDLAEYVDLFEDYFRLGPGEEKKAGFTIKATESGTTETNINVLFDPIDNSNGVGLTSTIIVIVEDDGLFGGFDNKEIEEEDSTNSTRETDVKKDKSSLLYLVLLLGVILLILVIITYVIYSSGESNLTKTKKAVNNK